MVSFSLSPKRVAYALVGMFVFLLLAHGIGLLSTYGFGHDRVFGLVPLFNIALEHNVPTLFATLLLLSNGFLFFVLFRAGDTSSQREYWWLVLSLVFCFLAVDEFAVIHEGLINPLRRALGVGGYLFFAWIIPYAIGVAVLALLVVPAIWHLGWRYRFLFGASGLVYLGGAIGVEMIGGNYYQANQRQVDLNYRLLQTVEESLEFVGLIILVYTLLDLIRNRSDRLIFQLS